MKVNLTDISFAQRQKMLLKMKNDPLYFGQVMFPDIFNKPFAAFHKIMVDMLVNPSTNLTTVILVPRGFGKSVIASFLVSVWLIMFRGYRFIILSSMSSTRANQLIYDIQRGIESDIFKAFFGDMRGERWGQGVIELKNDDWGIHAQILARGVGQQVLGLRFYDTRPQLFIGDDCENIESVENVEIIDKYVKWVNTEVEPGLARGSKRKIYLIGTTFKDDSMITRISKYEKGVTKIFFPALAIEETAEICGVNVGQSIWEEMFPTVELEEKRNDAIANNTLHSFMSQYQLDPRAEGINRFSEDSIKSFSPDEVDYKEQNLYLLIDAAYERGKHNDESGMCVVGVTKNKEYYVWEALKGRWDDKLLVKNVITVASKYKGHLQSIYIETLAFGFVSDPIYRAMKESNIMLTIQKLEHKNRPKELRIKPLVLVADMGELYIKKGSTSNVLIPEMIKFHGEAHQRGINVLDAFSYILDVGLAPHKEKTAEEKNLEWFKKNVYNPIKRRYDAGYTDRQARMKRQMRYW